jgi:hypothetical protein
MTETGTEMAREIAKAGTEDSTEIEEIDRKRGGESMTEIGGVGGRGQREKDTVIDTELDIDIEE